jgi:glycosyltransferase involved in cell wall biosynthesis
MRILFISRLYHPHIGGVEKHVAKVAEVLSRRGHKLTIVTEKFEQKLKNKESLHGVKVVRFSYPKIKFVGLIYIWYWLIKNRWLIGQTDLIHAHDVFVWYLPFRFLFPRKPVYVTFHGYEGFPVKTSAKFIRKISEKLSKGNMCIGDFIKKWYDTNPTRVLYGAVDIEKFKPQKQKKEKYDAVFSSRLDDQTGILTYLDAVKVLRKRGVQFQLVVLGDGKYRKEAERVAKAKGFVQDPSPYFKQARFAFVSRYLAILEAFASKKLVFAVYDNPIKRDYLKMTPFAKWIVIEKSSKKLADKVSYFMKHPEKAERMKEAAYKWVREQTWDKLTDQYLELWGLESDTGGPKRADLSKVPLKNSESS